MGDVTNNATDVTNIHMNENETSSQQKNTTTYYKNKATALKKITICDTPKILCNRNITKYFLTDDYQSFLSLITKSINKNFYEYIKGDKPVCFFYDIEIYDNVNNQENDDFTESDFIEYDTTTDANEITNKANETEEATTTENKINYFENYKIVLDDCINYAKSVVWKEFPDATCKTIILESHSVIKKSFHIILRFYDNNQEIVFENVQQLKNLYKNSSLDKYRNHDNKHIVDPSVYREGLFRTLYSTKSNENRPLIRSDLSDDFNDIESFVGYIQKDHKLYSEDVIDVSKHIIINNPEDLNDEDKSTIRKFVQKEFHHYPNRIRDIFVDKQHNCIVVALIEKYCPFVDREHRGNNQYIVIDTCSAKQKCHNIECNQDKYNEIKLENYPKEINEIIKKCLEINQQELDLIDHAIIECKNYINENFDRDVQEVLFDRKEMIFRGSVSDKSLLGVLKGKCPECNVEHQISDTGYCLKCKVCEAVFPKNQIIPLDDRYKNLNSFWMNYNQLVNNGTINNIINIYNNSEEDFSCDIKLDNAIFKNKEITNIINQILDGHKITMISKLIFTVNKDFVYSRNNWYYFTGSIWRCDNDNIEMKKQIIDLSKTFDRIKTFYENKNLEDSFALDKNIKSLINKFHKPGFQDEIIKGAKIYNNDEMFMTKLNSKKHLIPFTNGVYDLIVNKFRKTKKEDCITLTVNFDYDQEANNPEVYTFLEQVLPIKRVRDYILKKMSECLNGDIPNTYFLMFIGDSGANGKSQLLNLMKLAMGDFGEKVEVTLLTRKRNNANEANTEKMKLMNKRFAFLSEPEDGEKINIGLLKELTGSEEIVARGLYQDAMSFVMEAKLFLACNELPEIKGEDTALWRRIRVIDFPSRFVDNPQEPGEYKIDRTLPSRMREDTTWRQTFMKILIEYYYKDIIEPLEVQVKTNEYRQENNDFYNWMEENLEPKENGILHLKEVCQVYLGKTKIHSSMSSKYKKEIEKYIKEKYKNSVKWEYDVIRAGDKVYRGWRDIAVRDF
jgi:P4 family phage/plasmid primase-like protien